MSRGEAVFWALLAATLLAGAFALMAWLADWLARRERER